MAKNGPLKTHGGKSYLSKWIHQHAPPSVRNDKTNGYTHRLHPYAGGLGELWSWPHEGISEAVNDLNQELTGFYNVVRNEDSFEELQRIVSLWPFGDHSFNHAKVKQWESWEERAAYFFIRNRMSRQGLGKDYATPTRRTRRGMNENVSAYLSAVDGLVDFHLRLRRVEVRCVTACDFIATYDHERAFFYLDPPYLPATRKSSGEYGEYEMTKEDHKHLLEMLEGVDGFFMLSGYPSLLYDRYRAKNGWRCVKKLIDNKASSKKAKEQQTECLWMNYTPEGVRL